MSVSIAPNEQGLLSFLELAAQQYLIITKVYNMAKSSKKIISKSSSKPCSLPTDWQPRPIDIKSGWKHNANTLAKIVTAINDETYVEDESAEMERIDIVLGWIAERYNVVARQ